MKYKKYYRFLSLFLVFLLIFAMTSCNGSSTVPDDNDSSIETLLSEGEQTFVGDRSEVEETETNIDDDIQSMIELYGNGYVPPDIVHMEEDPVNPGPEPDGNTGDESGTTEQSEVTGSVGSRDDLLQAIAQLVDDASDEWVSYTLEDGYTFTDDDAYYCIDRLDTEAWMNAGYVTTCSWYQDSDTIRLNVSYRIDTDTIKQQEAEARELAAEVESKLGLSQLSDAEKIKAVNDYLCQTVVYPENIDDRYDHSPWRPLKEGIGVCDGYARAADLLLSDVGINIIVICGTTNGGGHAWNMVQLDGKWYQMDICWDATGSDTMQYLLVDDDYMKQSRVWMPDYYPEAVSGCYSWN